MSQDFHLPEDPPPLALLHAWGRLQEFEGFPARLCRGAGARLALALAMSPVPDGGGPGSCSSPVITPGCEPAVPFGEQTCH